MNTYKSLANINKKYHDLKLAFQDLMSGLNGADRFSTKLADMIRGGYPSYQI